MAVEAAAVEPVAVEAGAADAPGMRGMSARPYEPGWTDVIVDWIRSRPWPRWLTYLALIAFGIVVSNLQNVLSGSRDIVTVAQTGWGIVTFGFIAVIDGLSTVAGNAFDAFRPALAPGDVDQDRARYELTTIPRRTALVITLIAGPFTAYYYVVDPVAASVQGLGPVALAARWLFESFFSALLLITVVQAVRQLRLVSRLHARATRVDPFHPAPLHAFSRLTSLTGLALILVIALGIALNPAALTPNDAAATLWLPWLVGFPALALVIFVVPLQGMHGRLVRIKGELRGASEDRIKAVLAAIHHDVDALDLSRADGLQKSLASLLQEREILAKLSTWPWSAGTIRGFASALFLPIALFLIQRFLSQVLS